VRDVSVVTHPAYLATSTEARDAAAYLDFKKKQEEAERLFDVNMAAADLLMMKNKLSLSKPHGTWLK
jgi:phage head maturation protease